MATRAHLVVVDDHSWQQQHSGMAGVRLGSLCIQISLCPSQCPQKPSGKHLALDDPSQGSSLQLNCAGTSTVPTGCSQEVHPSDL